jgi:hypothetical protein
MQEIIQRYGQPESLPLRLKVDAIKAPLAPFSTLSIMVARFSGICPLMHHSLIALRYYPSLDQL